MKVIMNFKVLTSPVELAEYYKKDTQFQVKAETIEERYQLIQDLVERFDYPRLSRREKHCILRFLKHTTGYRHSQLARLIVRAQEGRLERKTYERTKSYRKYTNYDISLLEETDELHFRLSSSATHEILRREYEIFGRREYEAVSQISRSHITNLRNSSMYQASYLSHTQARQIAIGETKKPEVNSKPGSIRIDTVSQKDIYLINAVDEVTQWEVVAAVPSISERYLAPVLEIMLDGFPFLIFNFHSDRGSEFINKVVARLLEKLLINQTKSRSRYCNDQALVEGKNGNVVRKNFGYYHVNKKMVDRLNSFYEKWFNPYLNYHRPCGFVTETVQDHKGRLRKIYGQYTTPYEKLKEIAEDNDQGILKQGITIADLNKVAYAMSDNQFAKEMRKRQFELDDINSLLNKTT